MDRRQVLITVFAAITMIVTVWLYGGHNPWMLCVSAACSIFTFLWLFLPTSEHGCGQSAKENFFKLLRFPLFWIGLLLFAYILVQWARPQYEMLLGGKVWHMFKIIDQPSMAFPTSISAPFGFGEKTACTSPLRQFCILGNAWLMLCTLWCGLSSRRAIKWLTLIFIGNALLAAMFGIYQQVMGINYYLGARTFHFGPFFYTNHAAEFFAMNIALCTGIALRSWRESAMRFERGGWHLPLAVVALFFIIAAIATNSIGGSFIAIAWIPIAVVLIFCSRLLDKKSIVFFSVFAAVIAGLGVFWFSNANLNAYFNKIDAKIKNSEIPDIAGENENATNPATAEDKEEKKFFVFAQGDRKKLRDLSEKIYFYNPQSGDWWTDHHTQIYGWGAGSYRWIAPAFQRKMPELSYLNKKTGKREIHSYANYAHCDIWNMLVEWGAAGTGIFICGVLWFWGWALANIRRWRLSSVAYLVGIALFIFHGTVDFMIYSPFLALTLALIVANFKLDLAQKN
ncbi:MAG: O-antigen ligase family protein [Opitutales bacterium]|nr:O-antigen ligase family protein [Opitutales bacterium]